MGNLLSVKKSLQIKKISKAGLPVLILLAFIFLSAINLMAQGSTNITDGLTAYWPCDEGAGTLLQDSTGHGYNGKVNGPIWAAGKTGKALSFDGINDYVDLGTGTFNLESTNAFSIAFWINFKGPNSTGSFYQKIITRGLYVNPFSVQMAGNKIQFCLRTNTTNYLSSVTSLQPGLWYHVLLTMENGYGTVYLNGQRDNQLAISGQPTFTSGQSTWLGAQNGTYYLNGLLDNIRIYQRCLSATETTQLYSWETNSLPVTNPPRLDPLSNQTVSELDTLVIELKATAANPNSPITYGVKNAPANAYLLGNIFTFTPAPSQTGQQYQVTFTATDNQGLTGETSISIAASARQTHNNGLPVARVSAQPSVIVDVGEEVFFDASGSSDDKSLVPLTGSSPCGRWEWNFGDGTVMQYGAPYSTSMDSGISCVHFFMKPGIYKVLLTLTDTDGLIDTVMVPVLVNGEAPYAGFELWHAPYESRLAQYIFARIPADLRTYRLKVSLTGDNGYAKTIFDKTGLNAEEKFLLTQRTLPQGNYTLLAEIWRDANTRITYLKEKFRKPYDGLPGTGINENNAICINGQPFFPVTAWLLNKDYMPNWQRYINTVYGQGYYPAALVSNWSDYLDNANKNHYYAIGPERWVGKLDSPALRNSNPNLLADYLTTYNKNHPAQLMWMWADEPNLGGRNEKLPAPVLGSWTYKTHQLDPQHPVATQLYGFNYLRYYNPTADAAPAAPYNFLQNAQYFGKKHLPVDVIGSDIYPIEFNSHPSLNRPEGLFELWLEAFDNMQKLNYSLVPAMNFIETQDVKASSDTAPGPTAQQLQMEIWSSLVHNAKGINWFQYFDIIPPENYGVMEEFVRMMKDLTPVVLGPETGRQVTDNANQRGNRVDTLVRETATDIYILAVRITEPDFDCTRDGVALEPASLTVNFSVSGLTSTQTSAYDYFSKQTMLAVNAGGSAGNTYTATLANRPVPGSVTVYGYANTTAADKWVPVFDNGSGLLSGTTRGRTSTGTIDYSTSRLSVTFGESIVAGTDKIKITYLPVRSDRILTITNGSFTDTFQRCAVHIYRIPKQ